MDTSTIFLEVFQISIVLFFAYRLVLGFNPFEKRDDVFNQYQNFIEVSLTVLTAICFVLNRALGAIPNNEGFRELSILVTLGLVAYWIKKAIPAQEVLLKIILSIITGTLIFTSLYACIHIFEISPLVIFPGFGLLVITPFYVLAMVLADFLVVQRQEHPISAIKILGASAVLFLFFGIVSNLWTENPWNFFRYLIQPIDHTNFI